MGGYNTRTINEPRLEAWFAMSSSKGVFSEDDSNAGKEPIGRKGCCSAARGGKLYLFGGYPFPHPGEIDVFDFRTCCWNILKTNNFGPIRAGASCTVIKDDVFTFGGFFNGVRHADIHKLDLQQATWKKIEIKNESQGPMSKDKAGLVDYGEEMLCVVGGFGYFGDRNSGRVGLRSLHSMMFGIMVMVGMNTGLMNCMCSTYPQVSTSTQKLCNDLLLKSMNSQSIFSEKGLLYNVCIFANIPTSTYASMPVICVITCVYCCMFVLCCHVDT